MRDRSSGVTAFARVLRWIARSWSAAAILLVVMSMALERTHPTTTTEWVGFLFFPIGVSVGMILAWWKEGLGGSVAVASFFVFYVVHVTTAGSFPPGLGWLAVAAPGFLFLICWRLSRTEAPPKRQTEDVSSARG
jgi:hypothetical protein